MAAGVGALLAVLAWAGWSALGSGDSRVAAGVPALLAPPPARLGGPAHAARDVAQVAAASEAQAGGRPVVPLRPDARALPVVPDGFALEHGQLTAVRAPAGTAVAPIAPIAPGTAALPAGVQPEDAVVSPTGMVAVMRAPAAAADSVPNPPRPASVTHSP